MPTLIGYRKWECDLCGAIYSSKEEAMECEQRDLEAMEEYEEQLRLESCEYYREESGGEG